MKLGRRIRTVVATATATAALSAVGLAAAPPAAATSPFDINWEVAFQADDSSRPMGVSTLWAWGEGYNNSTVTSEALSAKPDIAPGTSPSIATLPISQGTFQVVWQGLNGDLWSTGANGPVDLGLGMKPGTSPSLTELTYGGWQAAFQANTGALWVTGSDGTGPVGDVMDPASSPAIVSQPGGGYEVAYQSATHAMDVTGNFQVGTVGPAGTVAPGTSPALTTESATAQGGGYQVAWEGADDTLWTVGMLDEAGRVGLPMAPGTSPSITTVAFLPSGALPFEIAYQSNTGTLALYGGEADYSTGNAMAAGASPAITELYIPQFLPNGQFSPFPAPGYQAVYEGGNGTLWATSDFLAIGAQPSTGDSGVHLDATTRPSITTLSPAS